MGDRGVRCFPPPAQVPTADSHALDAAELRIMRRVFDIFDSGGDGKIEASEIASRMGELAEFMPKRSLNDKVRTVAPKMGKLSCVKLSNWRVSGGQTDRAPNPRARQVLSFLTEDVGAIMEVFDQDGDGEVDFDEFVNVLCGVGGDR